LLKKGLKRLDWVWNFMLKKEDVDDVVLRAALEEFLKEAYKSYKKEQEKLTFNEVINHYWTSEERNEKYKDIAFFTARLTLHLYRVNSDSFATSVAICSPDEEENKNNEEDVEIKIVEIKEIEKDGDIMEVEVGEVEEDD